jgi:hypothetical protein
VSQPRPGMERGSRLQLWALLFITLVVMLLGILVVLYPERMGVPQPLATPAATPMGDG